MPVDASSHVKVPHYKCRLEFDRPNMRVPAAASEDDAPFVAAPEDLNYCIKLRPLSFRFKVGDSVVVNLFKAEQIGGRSGYKLVKNTWLRGKVTAVDVSKFETNYAVYECSLVGEGFACRIFDDKDENVARADADGRERLFDAIEQNCSRSHLNFLCGHFDIDVSVFRDLVVAKAIEFASSQALSWLQHDCDVDVLSMRDDSGNNLLHQIAKSTNATRFIREVGRSNCIESEKLMLDLMAIGNNLHHELNNGGELWIQSLITRGDSKALDAALSPHHGFAWNLCDILSPDRIQLLEKSVHESEDVLMRCIFDSFLSFRALYQQFNLYFRYFGFCTEDQILDNQNAAFWSDDANQSAKSLVRFCRDWCQHPSKKVVDLYHSCATEIVVRGSFRLFKLFYEADEDGFRRHVYNVKSKEDRGEYIQSELYELKDEGSKECDMNIEVDIFNACIIGRSELPPIRDKSWITVYQRSILQHATECDPQDCSSLYEHLVKDVADKKHYSIFFKRIALLEDDENVEGRQQILDYLIHKEESVELDVLQPLKHRQCWALRFMIEKRLLQVDTLARRNLQLIKASPDLLFLQDSRLEEMTVKCCLCFAAVQYDDLQSLEFLCQSSGIPVVVVGGWNLLHFAAYMGRIEIIAWISSQPAWELLVAQVCVRKEFQNAFPVHIAAIRGHLQACDLMIELKVPLEDSTGRLPEDYAKASPHQYVLDWAEKKGTPKILEADVKKILELLSDHASAVDDIKHFIEHSTCFVVNTWMECDYTTFDAAGPLGYSFGDVLHQCCSSLDVEIVAWICLRLFFRGSHDLCTYYSYMKFWVSEKQKQRDKDISLRNCYDKILEEGKINNEMYDELTKDLPSARELEQEQERARKSKETLTQNDLVNFATDQGHDFLSSELRKKWFKNLKCNEPLTYSILSSALNKGERLEVVRAKILRVNALLEVVKISRKELRQILARGGRVTDVQEILSIHSAATDALIREGYDTSTRTYHPPTGSFYDSSDFDPIDMDESLHSVEYDEGHPLRKQLLFMFGTGFDLSSIHIVLATEGYSELMSFCLSNFSGWTATMELDVVRISTYFGHSTIAEMFLSEGPKTLLSGASDRHSEAILGAGEALRYRDLVALVERFGSPSDPIDVLESEKDDDDDDEGLSESLVVTVLNGYVRQTFDRDTDNITTLKTLSFVVDKLEYSHDEVLLAMVLITRKLNTFTEIHCILDISKNVINMMGLQPIHRHEQIRQLCEAVAEQTIPLVLFGNGAENIDEVSIILQWLGRMADSGIDIQHLIKGSRLDKFYKIYHLAEVFANLQFTSGLRDLEQKQQREWSNFAIVKKGGSLIEIQGAVDRGDLKVHARDQGGLLLTHLSAAYDRVDLLEWLVVTKCMQLDSKDIEGRTALDIAQASKALQAMKWIAERTARNTITSFLRRNYHRALQKRRIKKSNNAAIVIQRSVRGYSTKKQYSGALSYRLEESKRFHAIWGHLLAAFPGFSTTCWSSIRGRLLDIQVGIDDDLFDETDERLRKAIDGAVEDDREDEDNSICDEAILNVDVIANDDDDLSTEVNDVARNEWLSFQMTSHVVKFLQRGDKKYRYFFVRRMQQLARGERSRILQKPLKGSQSHIFETYLEQKSGHRILWTEESEEPSSPPRIVIWYVAKHKHVSRLMQLIDDSKSRSARQLMPQTLVDKLQNEDLVAHDDEPKREVLLDIVGNVPLKIYDVSFNTISEITKDSWTPQLHLTEEERDIVEAEGTVLVLARSGTGKTVCICNRIEYDRQSRAGRDPTFTQLFVARSVRLCRYVEGAVGEDHRTSFSTFSRLLNDIETSLPVGHLKSFNPSNKMDFRRFKQELYTTNSSSNSKISALTLWTVIRTFIKGSIKAFQNPDGVLPRDEFVEVERLGKNRCRIPAELREQVYDEFRRYEAYLKEQKLWDDCDRVRHLITQIEESKEVDPDAFGQVQKSKVYVDEVQDYTQLEMLVFFYLCGPNGLFLAGDPAQSVVEGTEFRFEEVRSVGHFVGSIMQKPKTVNINFRSHSGILNCAGGVLDLMFTHFPSSAKQLKKDKGLFQGSRPGVLLGANVDQLNILLSDKLNGAVVLTHDDSASHWRRRLNDYKRVYGIREAKGLEFKTVIILDFFQEIPPSLQKPWRELVLNRAGQEFEYKHPLVGNILKLLYTGVTRCIEKLFFVETSSSTAGKATIRWLTQKGHGGEGSFATQNNIDDIEAMSMTADEFVGEGINNAELSQSVEDLDEVLLLLERASWCFEQADSTDLAAKARMQHSSVLFRRELETSRDQNVVQNHAVIEMRAAKMMESLSREGLFFEVLNCFDAVRPYLSAYASEQLERGLISDIVLAETEEI
eukprot:scaffold7020_cov141-Skeletonema_marinoi.AAC.9